ncbi:MAG: hypothetical protein JWQ88_1601 [Rhodoferax sp.]|nr:hypothetical protein [Rhodoferax sp.]
MSKESVGSSALPSAAAAWLAAARANPIVTALLVTTAGLMLAYMVGSANPGMAMLPDDLGQLERIQPAIDQLEPEDRALLLAFVKRETSAPVALRRAPNARPATVEAAITEQRRLQDAPQAPR